MKRDEGFSFTILSLFGSLAEFFLSEVRRGSIPSDLTITQIRTLLIVRFWGNRVGAVAEIQGVSQPAASRIVDDLVAAGYLKRVANDTDRRKIDLNLTAKGDSLLARLHERTIGRVAKAAKRLPLSEQKKLREGLGLFADLARSLKDGVI